ncbi:hypothetical protein KSW27_03590 [Holdemanella biformis]|jgi:tetratricopeptide (TPR) repeat protein|uniref:hypothetical protein n=1 Tax=Holdemanella biformis TaxID=1735 RepID=UPI001C255AC5|nr:hypothetical protein [Holdemanella biformis]MBU9895341.1 hypothetical protein [Holdemanella biformis]MBV3416380.1 hypothetical protein [Holdemanella biformis]
MWKYRCKSHLISLIVAFAVGVGLSVIVFSSGIDISSDIFSSSLSSLPGADTQAIDQVLKYLQNNMWILYMGDGLLISGIINVIYIGQYLTVRFNISPWIVMCIIFFLPEYMIYIGTILVIPAFIVCIYGMLSLRSSISKERREFNFSSDDELVRMYEIHHKLDESYKELAKSCRKNVRKLTSIYALGIVALFVILFVVNNIMLLAVLLMFYLFAFNLVLRYRAVSLLPITKLLYEDCNPEACASAIIYYSTNRKGHTRLTQHTLLAQCLIYLNDPELAQDVLISYPRKDAASSLQYWSLMSYIDYMLKDEEALNRCKEEAQSVRLNYGRAGVMIQSEEMASIENKIHLMDGDFNTCKKYYLQGLQRARFAFQQVDSCYYIALISFVEEDYKLARMYFEKVIEIGNRMYFVEKAKSYLEKIDAINPEASNDVIEY